MNALATILSVIGSYTHCILESDRRYNLNRVNKNYKIFMCLASVLKTSNVKDFKYNHYEAICPFRVNSERRVA